MRYCPGEDFYTKKHNSCDPFKFVTSDDRRTVKINKEDHYQFEFDKNRFNILKTTRLYYK